MPSKGTYRQLKSQVYVHAAVRTSDHTLCGLQIIPMKLYDISKTRITCPQCRSKIKEAKS